MGYSVFWHVPNRLYIVHLYGHIDVDEMYEGVEKSIEFIVAGEPPVHSIVDARQVTHFPKSLKLAKQTTSLTRQPNLGWVMTITEDRMIRFMTTTAYQLAGVQHREYRDPSTVITDLQHIDPSLGHVADYPDLTADA